MNVKIVVDSTCDLIPEVQKDVVTVPLTIRFGTEEYLDGVTIDRPMFYEKLIESDVLPATSQVTPGDFLCTFERELQDGSDLVVLTVSEKLSGTYQSACIAAADYKGRVHVVDSHSVAIGSGILCQYALMLKAQGLTAKEIAKELENARDRVRIVAMLDTLEYLKKGGRISGAVAFAGELLGIKPVISLTGGEIQVLGKARGSRQGNNHMMKEIENAGGADYQMPLLLGYTGLSDALLDKYIRDSAVLWEGKVETLHRALIGSAVGTHVGPGAIAVAFFQNV